LRCHGFFGTFAPHRFADEPAVHYCSRYCWKCLAFRIHPFLKEHVVVLDIFILVFDRQISLPMLRFY